MGKRSSIFTVWGGMCHSRYNIYNNIFFYSSPLYRKWYKKSWTAGPLYRKMANLVQKRHFYLEQVNKKCWTTFPKKCPKNGEIEPKTPILGVVQHFFRFAGPSGPPPRNLLKFGTRPISLPLSVHHTIYRLPTQLFKISRCSKEKYCYIYNSEAQQSPPIHAKKV